MRDIAKCYQAYWRLRENQLIVASCKNMEYMCMRTSVSGGWAVNCSHLCLAKETLSSMAFDFQTTTLFLQRPSVLDFGICISMRQWNYANTDSRRAKISMKHFRMHKRMQWSKKVSCYAN